MDVSQYFPIHTDGMKKECLVCGTTFFKQTKFSSKQWESRRYCSKKCGLISINKNPDSTLEQRFFSKVVKEDGKCWLWVGGRDKNAYGRISVSGKPMLAHRVSWQIHKGLIDDGLVVRHMCDNPSCVNPDHLRLGTVQDNNNDALDKGRSQLNPQTTGEKSAVAKMNETSVKLLRLAHESGASKQQLQEASGLSSSGVNSIIWRRTWNHV